MNRTVLAVVTDLFFVAKIQGVARAAGVTLRVSSPAAAAADCADSPPDLVLVDLHAPTDLDAFIRHLKQATSARVIGFYSHVDGETRRTALDAGIDQAMPRSAFVTRLGAILAGTETPSAPEGTP